MRAFRALLMVLLAGTAIRFLVSTRFFTMTEPVWLGEVMQPLIDFVMEGEPISADDLANRSYGAVAYLLMHPVLQVAGRDPVAIGAWTTFLALLGLVSAYLFLARLLFPGQRHAQLIMAILWLSFAPLLYSFSMRHIDIWELGLLSASLAILASSSHHRWAGVPLVTAFLAKLLPLVVLGYVTLRDRTTFLLSAAVGVAWLAIAQLVYGSALGFLYPVWLAQNFGGTAFGYSFHHENNSLRGLIFKLAARFEMVPNSAMVVQTAHAHVLHVCVQALSVALIGHLAYVAWRGRRDKSTSRRMIQFALAVTTMMLVAPHLALEHMVPALLVGTIVVWHVWRFPAEWPRPWRAMFVTGIGLMGCFVPLGIAARLLQVPLLMRLTGNEDSGFYGANIAGYALFGFAGLGLVICWLTLVRLEVRAGRASSKPPPQDDRAPSENPVSDSHA